MPLRLTRRVNESFLIGDNIRVTIIEIRGFQATVEIEAPRNIPIHRQEIVDQIAAGVPFKPYENEE